MRKNEPSRRQLLSFCAEPGPGDGADPRFDTRNPWDRRPGRKVLQLCGQVARTLDMVLAGESGDEVLRDLVIVSVTPAPSSARLLVTVAPAASAQPRDPAQVFEHLRRAGRRLRGEVAAAVNRRRVPELTFRLAR